MKGSKPAKRRSRKKPSKRARAARDKSRSAEDTDIARLTQERDEASEQLSATSEVLRIISASRGDLEPVFEALFDNAKRLCQAEFGAFFLRTERGFRNVRPHDASSVHQESWKRESEVLINQHPHVPLSQIAETKNVLHIKDLSKERAYAERDPLLISLVDPAGARTMLLVPMLRDDRLIGVIAIYRTEVRPFGEKQIELLQNFAAEAMIAIENARLLNESRQRTAELTESLEQQTATSEVLRTISSSPGELVAIFRTILENATRICEAKLGNLYRFDGSSFHFAATVGSSPGLVEHQRRRGPFQPEPGTVLDRLKTTKRPIHCEDLAAEPTPHPVARLGGGRSSISVPMPKDNELIGAITIHRQQVRPFAEKQIELLQNFAAQAVIAIENARLLNQLRERTGELEKSYETVRQQASQLEAQAQELKQLNEHLEQRVSEQVGEIERMGRLRRFLPPQVADLIIASGAEKQLESHRREITALFCDLRGFTGFSESADPEDVIALLRE